MTHKNSNRIQWFTLNCSMNLTIALCTITKINCSVIHLLLASDCDYFCLKLPHAAQLRLFFVSVLILVLRLSIFSLPGERKIIWSWDWTWDLLLRMWQLQPLDMATKISHMRAYVGLHIMYLGLQRWLFSWPAFAWCPCSKAPKWRNWALYNYLKMSKHQLLCLAIRVIATLEIKELTTRPPSDSKYETIK